MQRSGKGSGKEGQGSAKGRIRQRRGVEKVVERRGQGNAQGSIRQRRRGEKAVERRG
jgi:hypothetical protein